MDDFLYRSISIIALLTAFYQAAIQRDHARKSAEPIPQINLVDREREIDVHVRNSGVGPFIVEKLIFVKGDKEYSRIEDCLDFDPKSYEHIEINEGNSKAISPEGSLVVFAKTFAATELELGDDFRMQLSKLRMKVIGRDIYKNRITVEQSFQWFARHLEDH